jgi:hypothetical protein
MQELQEPTRNSSTASFKEVQVDHELPDDIEKVSVKEKLSVDPNVVTWDGPNDPENPMNWSSKEKVSAIAMVSLITLLS